MHVAIYLAIRLGTGRRKIKKLFTPLNFSPLNSKWAAVFQPAKKVGEEEAPGGALLLHLVVCYYLFRSPRLSHTSCCMQRKLPPIANFHFFSISQPPLFRFVPSSSRAAISFSPLHHRILSHRKSQSTPSVDIMEQPHDERLSPRHSANFIVSQVEQQEKDEEKQKTGNAAAADKSGQEPPLPMIRISGEGVKRVAEMIIAAAAGGGGCDEEEEDWEKKPKPWDFAASELHPRPDDPQHMSIQEAVEWIFLIDTLNFSFWTPPTPRKPPTNDNSDTSVRAGGGGFAVTWRGTRYTGYFAACACVNRALEEGHPITTAGYMAKVTREQLAEVFRGDGEGGSHHGDAAMVIPMLDERVEVMREAGRVLLERFNGTFWECLAESNGSATRLLSLVVENFPSYRDFATFRHRRVSFLKRAQILVSDLNSFLRAALDHGRIDTNGVEGKLAMADDIGELTMFADYRVPQILNYFGVLIYSPQLMAKLSTPSNCIWENGSEEEVVIRAFSIRACDLIAAEVAVLMEKELASGSANSEGTTRKGAAQKKKLNAVDVDMFLWATRRQLAGEIERAGVPFHRVRCIYY